LLQECLEVPMKLGFIAAVLMAGTVASASAQTRRVIMFTDGDRQVVRNYYTQTYRNQPCQAGYVRRGTGECLPRNQNVRRRYTVGRPLARNVSLAPVPSGLLQLLTPAPTGYRYGLVDGDVVRYDSKSRLIVDAIQALLD
jgi:hypothetical protein